MEKSYSNILYNHLLAGNVIPNNDGVLTEVQVGLGGKGRRVDLLTRYNSPETYFAIEVKYWPHDFEYAFQQAQHLVTNNEIDCAFVAVPAEFISIANKSRAKFNQIGLLAISRTFQTASPVERATRTSNFDQNIKKWVAKHFDDPYYYQRSIIPKDKKYFTEFWKCIKSFLSPRIEIAFYALYCAQKLYSLQKFLSYDEVGLLGNEICQHIGKAIYKHVEWSIDDLNRVGIVEYVEAGKWYYRLNPGFSYVMKNELDAWIRSNNLDTWIAAKRLRISNDRGQIINKLVA